MRLASERTARRSVTECKSQLKPRHTILPYTGGMCLPPCLSSDELNALHVPCVLSTSRQHAGAFAEDACSPYAQQQATRMVAHHTQLGLPGCQKCWQLLPNHTEHMHGCLTVQAHNDHTRAGCLFHNCFAYRHYNHPFKHTSHTTYLSH